MKNFAAIDLETANASRASICSVGVVIVREGELVDKIYQLVRPIPHFYNQIVKRKDGLTEIDTLDAPRFPEVWSAIAPKLKDLPLVAHNSAFDENCLRTVFEAYQLLYPNYKFYCTLEAARMHLPRLCNHHLKTVASIFGHELKNHRHALAEAEACATIAMELIR